MDEAYIERLFYFKGDSPHKKMKEDELLSLIKDDNNYMIIAEGGMGKSYLSKRWEEKLSDRGYKRIKAQEIKFDSINDKMIIDNLDEIHFEKANNIMKQISSKKIKGVLIFSRPESALSKGDGYFKIINFTNSNNMNPRYSMEYQIEGENLYEGFSKYFTNLVQDEQLFDFLSILSFKLLTSGVIHYNSQSLFEFIRKYNVNNNSTILISNLLKSGLFKEVKSDIYFENKTIPAFFSIIFLKKFSHIKNSYLSYFDNFSSQLSFVETAKILKSAKGLNDVSWNLVSKNHFVFMFLERYEAATGLVKILHYGLDANPTLDATNLLINLICKVSNDDDFNGSIYLDEFDAKIFKRIDTKKLLEAINYGIFDDIRKRVAIHHFCNWAKHSLCFLKDNILWKEIKNNLKNIFSQKILNIQMGDEGNKRNFADCLFELNDIGAFNKETYENYHGPIESAIKFCFALKHFTLLVSILKKFGTRKMYYNSIYDTELREFLFYLIENKQIELILKLFSNSSIPPEINVMFLTRIGIKKIKEFLTEPFWNFHNRIKVTKNYYESVIMSFEDNYLLRSKFNYDIKISKNAKDTYDFNDIKKDITNFSFSKYFKRNIGYYPALSPIKIKNWDDKFIKDILVAIDGVFHASLKIPNILKEIEPLYQLIAMGRAISIEDVHPIVLSELNSIRSNSYRDKYWFDDFDPILIREKVINYFSDVENFRKIDEDSVYNLRGYLEHILLRHEKPIIIDFLTKLKNSLNPIYWWDLFYKYKDFEISKIFLNQHLDVPKNLYDFINNFEKSNYLVSLNILSIKKIKGMFIDLLKSEFSYFYRKGGGTIYWYDNFFSPYRSKNCHYQMFEILELYDLKEWYADKFIEIFPSHISKVPAAAHAFIYLFIEHLATLSYLIESINERDIVRQFKNNLDLENKPIVDRAWLNFKGLLFDSVNETRVFNITEFYRYMNDDWTRAEFNKKFKEEIIPMIREIYLKHKNTKHSGGMETLIHDEINFNLPELLMKKYSIIYQPESNPFNNKDARKRIDFILSRNNKYIFVELKSSNNSQLTGQKIADQLNAYKSNLVIADNYLVIFKVHNMTKKHKKEIETAAFSKNFIVIDVD